MNAILRNMMRTGRPATRITQTMMHNARPTVLIVYAEGGPPRRPASSSGGPPRPGGGPGSRPSFYRPPRPGGNSGGGGGGGYRGRNDDGRGRREQIPMNEAIRAPEVRLMGEDKEALGIMPTAEALEMAMDAGVDLIMVVADANPPVCRLVEMSKYNYELAKAAKDAKKKQRESQIETKELKLRPGTDVHDYQVKVRAAQKFLSKGDRVKLSLQFKGREMEFKEIGREMFDRFLEDLEGTVTIEQPMQMQGRQMTMLIAPKKEI